MKSRDSSVGTATGYRLDSSDSITGRGKIFLFSVAPKPALGSAKTPTQWVPGAVTVKVKW
jgi:hypothetical protein